MVVRHHLVHLFFSLLVKLILVVLNANVQPLHRTHTLSDPSYQLWLWILLALLLLACTHPFDYCAQQLLQRVIFCIRLENSRYFLYQRVIYVLLLRLHLVTLIKFEEITDLQSRCLYVLSLVFKHGFEDFHLTEFFWVEKVNSGFELLDFLKRILRRRQNVFEKIGGRSIHERWEKKFFLLIWRLRVVQIHFRTFLEGFEENLFGLDGTDLFFRELVDVSLALDDFL